MVSPTLKEAKEIINGGDYGRIPIKLEISSDMVTPIMAIRRLKQVSRHVFMFESAEAQKRWGRYTFLGYDPTLEITCQNGTLKIKSGFTHTEKVKHPGSYIRRIIAENKTPRMNDMPSFCGGLVGYFSYDYIKYSEPTLELDAKDEEAFQDVDLMLFDKLIVFDHYKQKLMLIVNIKTEDLETAYDRGVLELEMMKKLLTAGTM